MSRGVRRALLRVTALAVAVVLLWRGVSGATSAAHDFTLTDHDGQRFDLATQRGKVVLVFFGYSQCPDVCPTTLSKLSSVARRLGEQQGGMTVAYVSVDPERDTPAVLKADLGNFDLEAVGLTGTREEVDRVVRQYGAQYEIVPAPESAARYMVSHTTSLYVIDRAGRLVEELDYEATVDEIAAVVRRLLTP